MCDCETCKCDCKKPKRVTNAYAHYSDQKLADHYREFRDKQRGFRDELIRRGFNHEIKIGSTYRPVQPSRNDYRWRKLVVVQPQETILS